MLYAIRRATPLGIPVQLVRTLLGRRSMIPAPWIYLAALGLGVALGVAVDAWLGWPWWVVTLAVVTAVWLLFLASAFTVPDRAVGLGDELLDAIRPGRAAERRARREAQWVRSSPFPLYGLDASWGGRRMLGGVGWRGSVLTSVELTPGDPVRGPWIRVQTAPPFPERSSDLRSVATDLWFGMETDRPPRERRSPESWTRVTIPVQGQSVQFDLLDENSDWGARAILDGLAITILAHRVPIESVRLVVITNVEPYIQGDERFFRGGPGSEE
jgi:hypothetical protein